MYALSLVDWIKCTFISNLNLCGRICGGFVLPLMHIEYPEFAIDIYIINKMKTLTIILFLYLSMTSVNLLPGQSFKVMTLNIRYDEKKDSLDNWHLRKQEMVTFFKKQKPVILGIQEGLYHQVSYIDSALMHYTYVGTGRDDGNKKGEYCALYVDTSQLQIVESGTFWLSDTPLEVSKGWDAALPRICTNALVRFKKHQQFCWVFNTHFDHVGALARTKSAELILKQVATLNNQQYPVILMGDLNASPSETPVKYLSDALYDIRNTDKFKGPDGTFNGFGKDNANRRIDYIFLSGFKALHAKHLDTTRKNGRYLSDHFAVLAKIKFAKR